MNHSEPKPAGWITHRTREPTRVPVLVVGAGQAGLAAARALRAVDLSCIAHERHARIGDSWRNRFDSLSLFSSREMSALPGLAHAGDPRGWPTKDEMGDYLEQYAMQFELPVVAGDGIARLWRGRKGFVALTEAGDRVEAESVVIATGGFQQPRVPIFANRLSRCVQQLDALRYRRPSLVQGRDIVVVGDGATGRQIALELAQDRKVTLARGRRRYLGPQRVFGRDFTWWAWRTGLLAADKASPTGRLVRTIDTTPGLHLCSVSLRRAGIRLASRCIGAETDRLTFDDGSHSRCDAVIWALGYEDATAWLEVNGAAVPGGFLEERGVSPIPGLFYVGREWQNSRASGLICGVSSDARVIAEHVREYLNGRHHQQRHEHAPLETPNGSNPCRVTSELLREPAS